MPLFHTRDKTGKSLRIVLRDISVTFTVVPALHKVVYLVWPSTFKVKVTRTSENACHRRHMVNSKSNMFFKDVTCSHFSNTGCAENKYERDLEIRMKKQWKNVGVISF